MNRSGKVGHALHLSRVWGSRHGGSIYSKTIVEELLNHGWQVTVLAEEFADTEGIGKRVRLGGFFQRNIWMIPWRARDIFRVFLLAWTTPAALVIVQGDLPRLTYVVLQLIVPLIFIRQDGILTCPGNNRFLPLRRSVCTQSAGLACLSVQRTEGCLGGLSSKKQIGRLAFRIRDRLLLNRIQHFVTCSRYLEQMHQRPARVLYPPLLTQVIAHSTPDGNSKSDLPAVTFDGGHVKNQNRRDLHQLVFCGRLEQVKGAADAIAILSFLPSAYRLSILGEGIARAQLERLADELGVRARLEFPGWVDRATRDLILSRSGALLMPSLWDEAFGMAGIEAMAQGTPVVAYDVGGISEWCREEAGILVRCGDVRAAAAAVRHLTEDPRRWAAYSQGAKSIAQLEFSPGRFARDLEEILRVAVQGRPMKDRIISGQNHG